MGEPIPIHDPGDERLAPFRDLRRARGAARPPEIVVESELAVRHALDWARATGHPVQAVLASPPRAARLAPLAPAGTPIYAAGHAVLRGLTGFDLHRACLACLPRPPAPAPDLAALGDAGRATVVLAVGLADPANLGAVLRNCRAFAVALLVADPRGADPFGRKAIRASAGQVFWQPRWDQDARSACAALAAAGFSLWATTPRAERAACPGPASAGAPLASAPGFEGGGALTGGAGAVLDLRQAAARRPARLALLLGSEGEGLPDDLLARSSAAVRIPIHAGVDSLNVAAASAVLLYALAERATR